MTRTDHILDLLVIYDHPRDFPDHYVVRGQSVFSDGRIVPSPRAKVFASLEEAQEYCEDLGLTPLARKPGDDPVIVETWL